MRTIFTSSIGVMILLLSSVCLYGGEMLVSDIKLEQTANDIYARVIPPEESNGDWTKPIPWVEGTLHFRAEIVASQPVPQSGMKLQWCAWQKNLKGVTGWREACGVMNTVPGKKGTVKTWKQDIGDMWNARNKPILWTDPRFKLGVAVKNAKGKPVYKGHFNGEDPKKWFPFTYRFITVVTTKGEAFSGWSNYVKNTNPPPPSVSYGKGGLSKAGALVVHKSASGLVVDLPSQSIHQILVTDLAGRRIYQSNVSGKKRVAIPNNRLKPGVLLVRCASNGKFQTNRVVIF